MTQAHRVDPRATALKNVFATINRYPRQARQFPLANPQSIKKLAVAAHIAAGALNAPADQQVRSVTKGLCLSLFLTALRKPDPDRNLLLGLLFFWHSHLEPISAAYAVAPMNQVILACSQVENLRDFSIAAQQWMREAYATEVQTQRTLATLLVPETFRKNVLAGIPAKPTDSERRTFGNYLNLAAREIALRIELLVPDAFVTEAEVDERESVSQSKEAMAFASPQPVEPVSPSILPQVAAFMQFEGFRLPGLTGKFQPAAWYAPRALQVASLRGEAQVPCFVNESNPALPQMAGFVAGVLGSGRTAFLKHLAWQYAEAWLASQQGPLAFYFSAHAFLAYARNRRSVYELVADQTAAHMGIESREEWLAELKRFERAGKLLLLVDDLDRLPDADQVEVLSQLTFSPAVVCAVLPWQVERLEALVPRPNLGVTELSPLNANEQMQIAQNLLGAALFLAARGQLETLCSELPYLAESPLGLMALLDGISSGEGNETQSVELALREFVQRAGLPPVPERLANKGLPPEWEHLGSAAFELLSIVRAPDTYIHWKGQRDAVVTKDQVENAHGNAWQLNWDQVQRTGLFRPCEHVRGEGLALVNRDLACYLVALAPWSLGWLLRSPHQPYPVETEAFLRRAERHWQNLNQRNRKIALSAPPGGGTELIASRSTTGSLLDWIPQLFRKGS